MSEKQIPQIVGIIEKPKQGMEWLEAGVALQSGGIRSPDFDRHKNVILMVVNGGKMRANAD